MAEGNKAGDYHGAADMFRQPHLTETSICSRNEHQPTSCRAQSKEGQYRASYDVANQLSAVCSLFFLKLHTLELRGCQQGLQLLLSYKCTAQAALLRAHPAWHESERKHSCMGPRLFTIVCYVGSQ